MQSVFKANRQQFDAVLNEGDAVVLFSGHAPKSTADAHYVFLTNKNFFYLTGIQNREDFKLLLLKTKEGLEATLFVDKPDYDVEKWMGRKLTKDQVTAISGVDKVLYQDQFEPTLTRLIYANHLKKVYFDLEKLRFDEPHSVQHLFAQTFMQHFPHIPVGSAHPFLVDMRRIKSDFEVGQIEKAVDLTKQGLEAVMRILKPGLYEYQLESTFSSTIRFNGADGNSFPTIAASGKDAVILHYVENDKVLEADTLVLMDLGAKYQEYSADITRTYPVSGTYTPRQKQLYRIVLKAMNATIESMKPGVRFEDLNKTCSEVLASELIAIGLIKEAAELSKYYYHGVSHHLGLDVHDLGGRDIVLEPGMVFTVEPGLYIEEEGIGIRIEDDILITEDGHRNLSKDIIKDPDAIEQFMASV